MIALLKLLPSAWRLGICGVIIAAAIAGYAVWHHKIYQRGYDAAIADVAAENQEAIDAAENLKGQRRACIARGGIWDVVSGLCRSG